RERVSGALGRRCRPMKSAELKLAHGTNIPVPQQRNLTSFDIDSPRAAVRRTQWRRSSQLVATLRTADGGRVCVLAGSTEGPIIQGRLLEQVNRNVHAGFFDSVPAGGLARGPT